MKARKSAQWSRLDNAAKIFPPTSSAADPKVFRFSCQLTEPVEEAALQKALDRTLELFPHYRSILRRGLFWYYLESTPLKPMVTEENLPPCSPLYDRVKRTLLFSVTYYRNRISLEVYHALTDGTGALQFLRTLTASYLALRHPEAFGGKPPLTDYDASIFEKADDSFQKYYDSSSKKAIHEKRPPACHLRGARLPAHRLRVTEGILSVREVIAKAHEYNTSMTVFLTAVYLRSIASEIPVRDRRKPVVASIPVNLRKYFESVSARNFFSVFKVGYAFKREIAPLEEVIADISAQFVRALTAEQLSIRINELTALEHNMFMRAIPLVIKDISLKTANRISKRTETTSLSNIGQVSMPPECAPYIELFDVFSGSDRLQMCMCSYADNLVLSFTSPLVSTDVQKRFFRALSAMDLSVSIVSNQPDADRL